MGTPQVEVLGWTRMVLVPVLGLVLVLGLMLLWMVGMVPRQVAWLQVVVRPPELASVAVEKCCSLAVLVL